MGIKERLEYWKKRCEAAESYIAESPCDPDIYPEQLVAYWKWLAAKEPMRQALPKEK